MVASEGTVTNPLGWFLPNPPSTTTPTKIAPVGGYFHSWRVRDSNPRMLSSLIYSQIPLAAWVTRHRTPNHVKHNQARLTTIPVVDPQRKILSNVSLGPWRRCRVFVRLRLNVENVLGGLVIRRDGSIPPLGSG